MNINPDDNSPLSRTSIAKWHFEIDKYLENSGINFTLIKPNFFMQNLAAFKDTISQESKFYATIDPAAKISIVHVADIAKLAYNITVNYKDHINKSYDLTGPDSFSFSEIAVRISKHLDRKVEYIRITEQKLRQNLINNNTPQWFIEDKLGFFKGYSDGLGSKINDISRVVNAVPISFESFVQIYN